ncbi:MAG: dTMP kinase [Candidatus Micrarchaeota archaeon]
MKGKLIVIDGVNASGKKTQVELLVERLCSQGKKAYAVHFPAYGTPFGQMVARYLNGEFGPREKVSFELASLLYAADRYNERSVIEGMLAEGAFVILDRYTQANLGYQTAELEGAEWKKAVKWLEAVESRLPQADAVFFLDVPIKIAEKLLSQRMQKNPLTKKDIQESDRKYEHAVYKNYLRLAKEKKWFVLNCVSKGQLKTREDIHKAVYAKLEGRKLV